MTISWATAARLVRGGARWLVAGMQPGETPEIVVEVPVNHGLVRGARLVRDDDGSVTATVVRTHAFGDPDA